MDILVGGDHRKPYRGDNGLQFKQAPGKSAEKRFQQWKATFGPTGTNPARASS